MKKNVKKKSGFTLIELIIVISIIAVLAAIAVPKYGKIQKNAKVKADIASAKVIADATTMLIGQEEINKANYSVGVELQESIDNEITGYLETVPVAKAVTGLFMVKIDDNDNVYVTVNSAQLYPTQVGAYPPAE